MLPTPLTIDEVPTCLRIGSPSGKGLFNIIDGYLGVISNETVMAELHSWV